MEVNKILGRGSKMRIDAVMTQKGKTTNEQSIVE